MSAHRRFDPISIPAEAGRRRVHRFSCSACPTVWDLSANTYGGARAIEDIQRKAKQCGWELGRSADHDFCGACAKARRQRGRGAHLVLISKVDTPPMTKTTEAPQAEAPRAETPRTMTREERRVIFAKLEETYVDEASGYSDGWSDRRVAEDLGVPRAWVETIRDENFGPHAESTDLREILEAQARLTEALTAVERRQAELAMQAKTLKDGLGELADSAAAVRGDLIEIRRRLKASGVAR